MNLRKSLCNCPHRSTAEKCCLAIKIRDFSYLLNIFFEIFLLRSVDLGVLVHFQFSTMFDRGVTQYFRVDNIQVVQKQVAAGLHSC